MGELGPESPLKQWVSDHPSIADCIEPFSMGTSGKSAFAQKRSAIHARACFDISARVAPLQVERDDLMDQIQVITNEPVRMVGHLWYSEPAQNLLVRQLTFAHRKLTDTKLRILNTRLAEVLLKLEQSRILLQAVAPESEVISPEVCLKLQPSFLDPPAAPSDSMSFRLIALQAFVDRLNSMVLTFEPPWSADFASFLNPIIEKATSHLEKSLSYSQPIPEEIDISRYFFAGGNQALCDTVDDTIRQLVDEDPATFVGTVIDLAVRLVPDYMDRSYSDQSIGLMMIFRVVFDRVYEKRKKIGDQHPFDEAGLLCRLARLPARLYQFPLEDPVQEDLDASVREYFSNQRFFEAAAQFLNEILWVTNPVDALYFVHRSLRVIHKAALVKKIGPDGEATPKDLKRLLGFDDLFAYLVGVLFATSIPNFFSFAAFIDAFAPRNCLSNSFEFAQAAISALLVHFRTLNVDEMEARVS
jgi:hypothetical protein